MLDPPGTVPLQIWRQGAKARATAILWLVKASNSRQNSSWQQISSHTGRKKWELGKRKLKLITELIFSFFLLPFSPPLWTLSCWWYQTSNFHNGHKLHHLDNIHHLSSALFLHASSEKKKLLRMLQSSQVKQQNQNKQKNFFKDPRETSNPTNSESHTTSSQHQLTHRHIQIQIYCEQVKRWRMHSTSKNKKNKESQNLLSRASSDQKNFNYLRLSCPLLSSPVLVEDWSSSSLQIDLEWISISDIYYKNNLTRRESLQITESSRARAHTHTHTNTNTKLLTGHRQKKQKLLRKGKNRREQRRAHECSKGMA